ncbi:hypothetical protein [Bacillus sp. NEB1478]|uniref:hypothetical protein n=1 Tax=Bacillus sp. NEB1478 TaxID=3073816 RepID=UPI00287327FF|nr:hypothetical protein [Bacillus sp. NEB1478]WNB90578.1 hypothetical protein RGB74_11690 [Bacillus sp. NEB1478]
MGNNYNQLQDECIRVQKVYDWVTDTLNVRKTVSFTSEQISAIEKVLEDPSLRPLRIVAKVPKTTPVTETNEDTNEHYLCEQVGDKRDVTVMLNGGRAEAQLVELLFTADSLIQIVDRNGDLVTELLVNASVFESFVLCYPDGTELYARISKIFSRIPSGTVLLNSPAPTGLEVDITFCVDIQVEAEVRLEVLAKFCSPRENDLVAPEIVPESEGELCPTVSFPKRCPDIYPRPGYMIRATGESSGLTSKSEGATETGSVAILVDISPNDQLANSTFRLSFDDTSDDQRAFNFIATEFSQDTLSCEEYRGGLKLTISGTGNVDTTGEQFDFNLALVQTTDGNLFEAELINSEGEKEFSTGTVTADEGQIVVENYLQHH